MKSLLTSMALWYILRSYKIKIVLKGNVKLVLYDVEIKAKAYVFFDKTN